MNTPIDLVDFDGVDGIVHLAGIAHRMGKTPEKLYFDVNYKLITELFLPENARSASTKCFLDLTLDI